MPIWVWTMKYTLCEVYLLLLLRIDRCGRITEGIDRELIYSLLLDDSRVHNFMNAKSVLSRVVVENFRLQIFRL